MNRHETWPEDLFDFLASRMDVPFQWGVQDCATLASGAVEAMTGERVFEVDYTDARGALETIERKGGLEGWLTEIFGEPVPPLLAQRGDIALLPFDDRQVLSVVVGDKVAAPAEQGVLFFPLRSTLKAWRV